MIILVCARDRVCERLYSGIPQEVARLCGVRCVAVPQNACVWPCACDDACGEGCARDLLPGRLCLFLGTFASWPYRVSLDARLIIRVRSVEPGVGARAGGGGADLPRADASVESCAARARSQRAALLLASDAASDAGAPSSTAAPPPPRRRRRRRPRRRRRRRTRWSSAARPPARQLEGVGVVVSMVYEGGSAERAGIEPGDVVVATSASLGGGMWPKTSVSGVEAAIRTRLDGKVRPGCSGRARSGRSALGGPLEHTCRELAAARPQPARAAGGGGRRRRRRRWRRAARPRRARASAPATSSSPPARSATRSGSRAEGVLSTRRASLAGVLLRCSGQELGPWAAELHAITRHAPRALARRPARPRAAPPAAPRRRARSPSCTTPAT